MVPVQHGKIRIQSIKIKRKVDALYHDAEGVFVRR
jgi:predicted nucleotidyltransferase